MLALLTFRDRHHKIIWIQQIAFSFIAFKWIVRTDQQNAFNTYSKSFHERISPIHRSCCNFDYFFSVIVLLLSRFLFSRCVWHMDKMEIRSSLCCSTVINWIITNVHTSFSQCLPIKTIENSFIVEYCAGIFCCQCYIACFIFTCLLFSVLLLLTFLFCKNRFSRSWKFALFIRFVHAHFFVLFCARAIVRSLGRVDSRRDGKTNITVKKIAINWLWQKQFFFSFFCCCFGYLFASMENEKNTWRKQIEKKFFFSFRFVIFFSVVFH